MKKLIIWAMLMFGFCSGMKAQEMAMRILVVDEWNRPLQGVAMHINGNDKETFLSDKEGVIECQVAKGAELSFIKYNQLQRKVTAAGTVMTVKLDKKNRIFDLGYDERVTKENTSAAIGGRYEGFRRNKSAKYFVWLDFRTGRLSQQIAPVGFFSRYKRAWSRIVSGKRRTGIGRRCGKRNQRPECR